MWQMDSDIRPADPETLFWLDFLLSGSDTLTPASTAECCLQPVNHNMHKVWLRDAACASCGKGSSIELESGADTLSPSRSHARHQLL